MDPSLASRIQQNIRQMNRVVEDNLNNSINFLVNSISALGRSPTTAPERERLNKLLRRVKEAHGQFIDMVDQKVSDQIQSDTRALGAFPRYSTQDTSKAAQLARELNQFRQDLQNLRIKQQLGAFFTPQQANSVQQEMQTVEQLIDLREQELHQLKKIPIGLRAFELGLATVVSSMLRSYDILRDAGFSYTQTFSQFKTNFITPFKELINGRVISWQELATAQTMFGRDQMFAGVPRGLQEGISTFTTAGGKDLSSLSEISYTMMQVNGWSTNTAVQWVKTAEAMSKAYKIPLDVLVKRMAENMNLYANYANRADNSIERLVTRSARLQINPQTFGQIADSLTNNFENYLESQAKLQTIMPGFDLTGVMIASQFGSDEDVMNQLQAQLGGRDIGKLPRSLRNLIAGSLGMSPEDLVKLSTEGRITPELDIAKSSNELLKDIYDELRHPTSVPQSLLGRVIDLFSGEFASFATKVLGAVFLARFVSSSSGISPFSNFGLSSNTFSSTPGASLASLFSGNFRGNLGNFARGGALGGIGSFVGNLIEGNSFGQSVTAGISSGILGAGLASVLGPALGALGSFGGPLGTILGYGVGTWAGNALTNKVWESSGWKTPEQEHLMRVQQTTDKLDSDKQLVALNEIKAATEGVRQAVDTLTRTYKNSPAVTWNQAGQHIRQAHAYTP